MQAFAEWLGTALAAFVLVTIAGFIGRRSVHGFLVGALVVLVLYWLVHPPLVAVSAVTIGGFLSWLAFRRRAPKAAPTET